MAAFEVITEDDRGQPRLEDPSVRRAIARVAIRNEVSLLLSHRSMWVSTQGNLPGVQGSMSKLFHSEAFQKTCTELLDLLGPEGVLQRDGGESPSEGWIEHAYRHAAVGTIYGGSSEVQREIIAGRGLGLPRMRPK